MLLDASSAEVVSAGQSDGIREHVQADAAPEVLLGELTGRYRHVARLRPHRQSGMLGKVTERLLDDGSRSRDQAVPLEAYRLSEKVFYPSKVDIQEAPPSSPALLLFAFISSSLLFPLNLCFPSFVSVCWSYVFLRSP